MNWIGFTTPWMLAGLAAVGLPVLIHYLTRARPRRIPFPPLRFLAEACAGQQAVHRLRTLLLLTLRCLAVLALVLLFARPFLKPKQSVAASESARRVVVVIDASLSMRAVQQGVTLFARAQAEAADVLRGLDANSEAGVILAGARPRPLLPALSRNIPALHEELVKAKASFEAGDPALALTLAKQMLGGAGTVFVFSDFQRANWEKVGELPGGIVWKLRNVAEELMENVAITSTRLVPAQPVVGEPAEVVCTVFNCSSRPRQETVRIELGDITHSTGVSVPPFGSAEVAFNVTFPRPGPVWGRVSLQPDNLAEDNVRHLAVNPAKALQVLLISDSEPNDTRSAAFYIAHALAPSPEAAPGLTLVRRHSQDADRGMLETADVFVLVSPALLTGETIEIISRRLNEGARLMAFLDGPTAPVLVPASFSPPFLLQRSVVSPDGDVVRPGRRALFAGGDMADFGETRFTRHYQTQLRVPASESVLLEYPDGSAALALSAAGRGLALFANMPLTPDACDLIGSPMFPAMLHESLRLIRQDATEREVTPGSAWTVDAPTAGEGAVTVVGPEETALESRVLASGRVTRLALPAAEQPGAYRIEQDGVPVAVAAVNIDPAESDTRPLAVETLKSGSDSLVSVVRQDEELMLAGRTRPLWPELAGAAAVFLALEMLLLAVWRRPSMIRTLESYAGESGVSADGGGVEASAVQPTQIEPAEVAR